MNAFEDYCKLVDQFNIKITLLPSEKEFEDLKKVQLQIQSWSCIFYIDDEYSDLGKNNYLDFLLILFELEDYDESTDIIEWANEKCLSLKNTKVIDYYRDFPKAKNKLTKLIKKTTPIVSYFDYHLGAGLTSKLRKL